MMGGAHSTIQDTRRKPPSVAQGLGCSGGMAGAYPIDAHTQGAAGRVRNAPGETHYGSYSRECIRGRAGRAVIEGQASKATLDRIWKHPNGGWRVILPVMGAVVGQTADAFIIAEKERLAHEREQYEAREARLGEMARDLRSVVHLDRRRAG